MKQLTDAVYEQLREALIHAACETPSGAFAEKYSNARVALEAEQPVQVNAMLVEALKDALHSLQVPRVSCQHGVVSKCKCRKCVVVRGDAALTAAQQAQPVDVNAMLVTALKEATTSLETISRLAGKTHYVGGDGERVETYMGHHDEVRGYATSRASVARAALTAAQQAQPERAGLTVEQIDEIWVEHGLDHCGAHEFARAIEAAHGIGGQHD